MKNIVTLPTCFKGKVLTMIDLVIRNVSKSLKNICPRDLSDVHQTVCFATKLMFCIIAIENLRKMCMYITYQTFRMVYAKYLTTWMTHIGFMKPLQTRS